MKQNKILICFVLLLFVVLSEQRILALPEKPKAQIKFNYDKNFHRLIAESREAGPYTVSILFTRFENVRINFRRPCTFVLQPGRSTLIHFQKADPKKPFHFRYKYRMKRGDSRGKIQAKHIYELPFARGQSFKIGQAYNGDFTHKGDNRFALDFALPQGTAIHAARDGRVIWTVDRFTEAGISEQFKGRDNRVEILHRDGSVARYGHMQRHGVKVKVGQRVKAGQLIGISGHTGYSGGPHLHFHVSKPLSGERAPTHPTLFRTSQGIQILKSKKSYRRP